MTQQTELLMERKDFRNVHTFDFRCNTNRNSCPGNFPTSSNKIRSAKLRRLREEEDEQDIPNQTSFSLFLQRAKKSSFCSRLLQRAKKKNHSSISWLGRRILMGFVVSSFIYYKIVVPPNLSLVCGLTQSFTNILYKSVANINNTLVELCNGLLQIEATFQAWRAAVPNHASNCNQEQNIVMGSATNTVHRYASFIYSNNCIIKKIQ
jgi:hypothetical protein